MTPILLLLFAAAADFGRAFYAYVAIENAAKEGALFGSRSPLCDFPSAGACTDPNNVEWRVQSELREQGIRQPDGSELTPSISCTGACASGDVYEVGLTYEFRLLTPILGNIIGDLNLRSASRAVVLNEATNPTFGASVNKFVSPDGAVNGPDIIAGCREPDDTDASGYYRSPCRNSGVVGELLTLRFEEGATIRYRLIVGNNGAVPLTGVSVWDSRGSTGCTFATSIAVGATLPVCNYTKSAPTVPGSALSMDYDNTATVDSTQTLPATSGVRVIVEKPPAEFAVRKLVSPFEEGADGDGVPNFGDTHYLKVTYRPAPQVADGSVWFKLIVTNTGGQPATGVSITDDAIDGEPPVTATCPAVPSTLNAGASWVCRYEVDFSAASGATTVNTVSVSASNVVADANDTDTATLEVEACTGAGNRTVPNLVGLTRSDAQTAWEDAGFASTLTDWGSGNEVVVAQNRPAFECIDEASSMTIDRIPTTP